MKVKNTIEKGAVKKFAEAIGDTAPILIDEKSLVFSRHEKNIAPPTFPVTLDYGTILGLHLPSKGLIHGEQRFHYKRPLYVGEEINCHLEFKDYFEKTGHTGNMSFLVFAQYGEDNHENLIFSTERVLIINEAVKKGMFV
jgi:hydroxyacyl-ACP dehydratase HTD2-like protein with hotdog domain